MIRIAICDDDPEMGKKISDIVLGCCQKSSIMFQKALFQGSKELLYEIEDGAYFDILFLDIEMPQMNGMELTEKLKFFLPDALVIFISSYSKYVYKSFKVQPFRFIPKAQIESMLPIAVNDVLRLATAREGKYIVVENKWTLEKIPAKSIVYIWHREKYVYIEKTDGKNTKVRKTLKNLYEELPPDEFVWVDRGCIVNLLQIESITGAEVLLKTGTKLSAGLDRLTDLKKKVRGYWLEKG